MKKYVISLLMVVLMSVNVFGALKPTDDFYVNDYSDVLSSSVIDELVSASHQLSTENGVQVVTVITNYYVGDDISIYASEVFNDFGIGSAKDNNGILLFIALEAGEVYIAVGDGMSGILPDSKTGGVLDEYFMPYAEDGDIEKAVSETHKHLISLGYKLNTKSNYSDAAGNTSSSSGSKQSDDAVSSVGSQIFSALVFVVIIIFIASIFSSGRRRRYSPMPRRRSVFFPPPHYHPPHHHNPPPGNPPSSGGGFFGGSSGGSTYKGGGGRTSGGGTSRSFGSSSGGSRPSGGSSFKGGGGRTSGGGASRSFGKK